MSSFVQLLLLLVLDLSSIATTDKLADTECHPKTTQVVAYPDLSDVVTYQKDGVTNYYRMVVDEENSQLIVGARDHLFKLSMENLEEIEVVEWQADADAVEECRLKGKSEEDCRNFIRVLLPWNGSVFVCGTYAFAPQCTWRPINDLSTVSSSVHGTSKCPYDPYHNNTALICSDGNIYSGTVTDFTARDPVIKRVLSHNMPTLRTVQSNSKWLSEPNFVSSYEIGPYIYFYFRETAVEYMNCGKTVYSRVARVCKNDAGGHFLLEDNWTTFMKARLNCSLPGEFPFYFDEIESTYYIEQENLTYIVFTTPKNSIHGSAVCAYDTNTIHQTFNGDFKYQENAQSAWIRTPNPNPNFQCETMGTEYARPEQTVRKLEEARWHQLLDQAVQPVQSGPLYTEQQHDGRFTEIVVDVVRNRDQSFHVMFIGTESGVIKKVTRPIGKSEACLVEEIYPFKAKDSEPIKTIKLHSSEGALFVGSQEKIVKIPVHRCYKYKSRRACVKAMDPYCGWDGSIRRCVTYKDSVSPDIWHQDMTGCPVVEPDVVDGEFGNWSDWQRCKNQASGKECLCRQRLCDSPAPQCGGEECEGETLQVTNCTVDGGWTEWSQWSACSKTCGSDFNYKIRQRTCANPAPQHGGKSCSGDSIQEAHCETSPQCPGVWSSWSQWSECSKSCNGGRQERNRICEGGNCTGCDREFEFCNQHRCPEIRKMTPWGPWSRHNETDNGYFETRVKHIFKARVPSEDDIYYAGNRDDFRFCPKLNNPCVAPEKRITSLAGVWTDWLDWLPCTVSCGTGIEIRQRQCQDPLDGTPAHDCVGNRIDSRECTNEICSVNGSWTCWSDWTECSASCGGGVQSRIRNCTNPAPAGRGENCTGNATERRECNAFQCPGFGGWDTWSNWSPCGPDNKQHRYRQCMMWYPMVGACEGPKTEHKACLYNAISGVRATQVIQCDDKLGIPYVVIIGVSSFLLGLVVAVLVQRCCCKKKHKRTNSETQDINPVNQGYRELFFKEENSWNTWHTIVRQKKIRKYGSNTAEDVCEVWEPRGMKRKSHTLR
ncbi:semaphorin-5A-like isoform X2 [Ptychodera flava]|uniref:semaphorin-5A-like isoform X2 n=1 Tax=Ptychodera flava TaxID=63121 RepID=UPI003969F65C